MKYLKYKLHKMSLDNCIDWILRLKIQQTLKGLNKHRNLILKETEDKVWEEHRL